VQKSIVDKPLDGQRENEHHKAGYGSCKADLKVRRDSQFRFCEECRIL